jgi:aldose sugar dehydrogenase
VRHSLPNRSARNAVRPSLERLEERTVLSPTVLDPNLEVRTVASGLAAPTSMAFLSTRDASDFLVLEKNTGRVERVTSGFRTTVLDLAVNNFSERGLLGIALHPDFHDRNPRTPQYVYLYWTESTATDAGGNRVDTNVPGATPLLGNRVDRFVWNGSSLTLDRNIIQIRAIQEDAGQPQRGNHDGGVIRFGPDGKLYAIVGDTGRRGQTQNLVDGPFGPGVPDDQFGGPAPDDAHRTGVIVRLNDDGTAPADNPFFGAGAAIGGEVGANVQKLFAYGIRNSFGMAFDPSSGDLWEQENGDDSFSELNASIRA